MRILITINLCIFLLSCGKINTSPEFFKPDDKCYVSVESSLSLNEKFRELLKEALKDNKGTYGVLARKRLGIEEPVNEPVSLPWLPLYEPVSALIIIIYLILQQTKSTCLLHVGLV